MEQLHYLAGHLLLAMPGMGDDRFRHAVIALCAHDGNGALGIAIGEPLPDVGLHDLLGNFDIQTSGCGNEPVMRGGPVEPQRGFVLHSLDWGGQDLVEVDRQWGMSGSLNVLKAIAGGRGPSRHIVALGYAGWGPGQLERELAENAWFVTPATPDLLFDGDPAGKWASAFARAGIDASLLVAGAGSA